MTQQTMTAGGWILVNDGTGYRWVYGPLWDPAKMTDAGKAILATQIIKQAIGATANPDLKDKLTGMLKEQVSIVLEKFADSILSEDDDWCATKPYPLPVPHYFNGAVPMSHSGHGPYGPGVPPYGPLQTSFLGEKLVRQIEAKISASLFAKAVGNEAFQNIAGQL